jgi:hypothetical protein
MLPEHRGINPTPHNIMYQMIHEHVCIQRYDQKEKKRLDGRDFRKQLYFIIPLQHHAHI